MEYDAKKRIEFHGKSLMRDAAFSVTRLVIVCLVVGIVFWGRIDVFMVLLMILYGAITILGVRKKMAREKIFYTFAPGNPTYDYLSELGDPGKILEEINAQVKEGKVIYDASGKPNKSQPETIITEGWFVYLDKRATVLPLDKIVCAYIYDNVTKETPPDNFLPTYFKPVYLIITYGQGREAIFKHSNIEYKKVLEVLDNKLGCKVIYTRELGTLFNTDYNAFLKKLKELRKPGRLEENKTPPPYDEGAVELEEA